MLNNVPDMQPFRVRATGTTSVTATVAAVADSTIFISGVSCQSDLAAGTVTVAAGGTTIDTIPIGNEKFVVNYGGDGLPGTSGANVTVAIATATAACSVTVWGYVIRCKGTKIA